MLVVAWTTRPTDKYASMIKPRAPTTSRACRALREARSSRACERIVTSIVSGTYVSDLTTSAEASRRAPAARQPQPRGCPLLVSRDEAEAA
jgi:hypothetical protein